MRILTCLLMGISWLTSGMEAWAATDHPAQVAGIYEGAVAVKGADGRKVTLDLKQDGALEFRDGGTKSAGHWSAAGQELRVEVDGKPAPLLWKIRKNALVLEDAKAEYGKKGLTLRRPR